jgi:hypothetical protein
MGLVITEGLDPVDLLLLMAAKENDAPRVAELLRAGADVNVKVSKEDKDWIILMFMWTSWAS